MAELRLSWSILPASLDNLFSPLIKASFLGNQRLDLLNQDIDLDHFFCYLPVQFINICRPFSQLSFLSP